MMMMYQEWREEEDLLALKTALTHRYKTRGQRRKASRKTDHKYQKQYWRHEDQQNEITRKQRWEEKQLYGRFKQLTSDISHDKA